MIFEDFNGLSCTTKSYQFDNIDTTEKALDWLCDVTQINGFVAHGIFLADTSLGSPLGRDGATLPPNAPLWLILKEAKRTKADLVFLQGEFHNRDVLIGADLTDFTISFTVFHNDADCI